MDCSLDLDAWTTYKEYLVRAYATMNNLNIYSGEIKKILLKMPAGPEIINNMDTSDKAAMDIYYNNLKA
jgi:hypothetical protein